MQLEFLDTTLRDGAQGDGISYSIHDKQVIFNLLDDFGIDLIEGGDPASNPKDKDFFTHFRNPKLVAFGSTAHPGKQPYMDQGLNALLESGADTLCIFGKASVTHTREVLKVSLEDNLYMISESVAFLRGQGKRVIFDAEHFFDGYLEDSKYALAVLQAAFMGGADTLVLCDTNGANSMNTIFEATKKMVDLFPTARIGIHAHNDVGLAVANSICAVKAGATHIQGTYLGFGERCGNANLSTIIANLKLKEKYDINVNIGNLTKIARSIAEISNMKLPNYMPYVGASAFAHKAGMHTDGVIKYPKSFQHIDPKDVGNRNRILLSEMAGRSAVVKKLENLIPNLEKTDPTVQKILDAVKKLELKGYQFDGADGSFILLAERIMGRFTPSFELIEYTTTTVKPSGYIAATIKIKVGNTITSAEAEGNGPVNALDKALRKALVAHYPEIEEVSLIDYKVRIVDSESATQSIVRVMITSSDHKNTWNTVGVSTNIIDASWTAIIDSLEFKLKGYSNRIK